MIGVVSRRRLAPTFALACSAVIGASVWLVWPSGGPNGLLPLAFQVSDSGRLELGRSQDKVDRSSAQVSPTMPEPYFGKNGYAPGVVLVSFKPGASEGAKSDLIAKM